MTTVRSVPAVTGGGLVSFFRAPASSIVPYKDISLVDIYHYITGPYAAERTAKLRSLLKYGAPDATRKSCGGWRNALNGRFEETSEGLNRFNGSGGAGPRDLSAARAFKRTKFDYVTFSGTFTRRTDVELVAHSGYLCLDFDHLDDAGNLTAARSVLLQDPHFETLLLFTSPSGNGLKWVIPIGNDQLPITPPYGGGAGGEAHRTWFNAVRNYLATTYHLDADPACVNVSRSCFLPHDPDCYIAPRLLPELAPTITEHPAVEDLMVSLAATNIQVIPVNNSGDAIAAQNPTNNEQAE